MLNLDTSVGMLGLTTRAYNVLMRNSIETLGDILITPFNKLKTLDGMGKKSFEEIINKIHNLGYINISEDNKNISEEVYNSILDYKNNIENMQELKLEENKKLTAEYRSLIYPILDYQIENLNLPINLFYYLKKININYIGDILKLDSNTLKKLIVDKKVYDTLLALLHYNGLLLIDENIENNDIESLNDFFSSLEIKKLANEDDELDSIYKTLKEINECKKALYIISERIKILNNHLITEYNLNLKKNK